MTTMTETARAFFDACESGKGWEGCQAYCSSDATFSAQCEALDGITTLHAYTDWVKGLARHPAGRELPSEIFRHR
jgi:hypothetical protein